MDSNAGADDVLNGSWDEVLTAVDDAVLVLDAERNLRFLNPAARRLLGYRRGESVGGRCRATTRGVDCESACPLTYALASSLDRVEDFETVYHTRDGEPVALAVTLIPLKAPDGSCRGAVEILRPTEPEPGFTLAGTSAVAAALRDHVQELVRTPDPIHIVADHTTAVDVARAIHRFLGLPDALRKEWPGGWDAVEPWPPGTMFVRCEASTLDAARATSADRPDGWRMLLGCTPDCELHETERHRAVAPPPVADREADLPAMVTAAIRAQRPELAVSPEAVSRLVSLTRDGGLRRLEQVLSVALPLAATRLETSHLPADGCRAEMVDECLRCDNPLGAIERLVLCEVLERCEWRVQEAADRLGVSRVTLWRKMRDHDIERPGNGGDATA